MLFVLLVACGLTPESLGSYSCSDYCSGIKGKAESCAADQGVTVAQFAGMSEGDLVSQCQTYIDSQGPTEAQCRSETAGINNGSCSDLAQLIGSM